jgi:hypothetical protein
MDQDCQSSRGLEALDHWASVDERQMFDIEGYIRKILK